MEYHVVNGLKGSKDQSTELVQALFVLLLQGVARGLGSIPSRLSEDQFSLVCKEPMSVEMLQATVEASTCESAGSVPIGICRVLAL